MLDGPEFLEPIITGVGAPILYYLVTITIRHIRIEAADNELPGLHSGPSKGGQSAAQWQAYLADVQE